LFLLLVVGVCNCVTIVFFFSFFFFSDGGDRFVVTLHIDATLRIWDVRNNIVVTAPCPLPSLSRHTGGGAPLSLAMSGHFLKCFPHPHDKDKFLVFCCASPKGGLRVDAKPALLVGKCISKRGGDGAQSPCLLVGAGHARLLQPPVLWSDEEVFGENVNTKKKSSDQGTSAAAFELRDAMLRSSGELMLMWHGDARLPFAWDGLPAAYTPRHQEQVVYARSAVRCSLYQPPWCTRSSEVDDSEEDSFDTVGRGRQWLDSNGHAYPLLTPSKVLCPNTSGGGFPKEVAQKDASALLRSRINFQEMQRGVIESMPQGVGVGVIPRLGVSLLRWFQSEVHQLERFMMGRFALPGRFSDASIRRTLRCRDGPVPFLHRRDVSPSISGTPLKNEVLEVAREWVCNVVPEMAALVGTADRDTMLVASDYDALLSDPLSVLATLEGIWLCILGVSENTHTHTTPSLSLVKCMNKLLTLA
jgi:hypothetical protein